MVGSEFIDFLEKWNVPGIVSLEDSIDKFNFLFTTVILIICSLVVSVKQYYFRPISCYLSTRPNGAGYEDYVENYCWVKGTLALGIHEPKPNSEIIWEQMRDKQLNYYQWVPFILGLQCVLFYMPRLLWLLVLSCAGSDIQQLVSTADSAVRSSSDYETRSKKVQHLARTLKHLLYAHRDYRTGRLARIRRSMNKYVCVMSKRLGTHLTCFYFFIKALYLLNAGGQLAVMHKFLQLDKTNLTSTAFGFEILKDIVQGRDWETTFLFPRVVYCRYALTSFANTKWYLAQCVLPVNMFNEKIFIFLWFWVTMAATTNLVSLLIWFKRLLGRRAFVRRFLKVSNVYKKSEKSSADKFVTDFLRLDGCFLLKMIQLNCGDLLASEIVVELFKLWKDAYAGLDLRNDPIENCVFHADDYKGAGEQSVVGLRVLRRRHSGELLKF